MPRGKKRVMEMAPAEDERQTSKRQRNTVSSSRRTNKIDDGFNGKRCIGWFKQYTTANESDVLGPMQMEQFCKDIGVEPEDVVMLVIAYKMNARQMGFFTQAEWQKGLTEVQCDSAIKLQSKLDYLRSLMNDQNVFKNVYRYAYDFARDKDQRSMDIETAKAMLCLLLGKQWQLLHRALLFRITATKSKSVFAFNLINCLRSETNNDKNTINEFMSNDWLTAKESTDTTIMAVEFDADSRTSSGTYVSNRVTDKLTRVSDKIYCCRSGSAADTQAIADIVSYSLNFHENQTAEIQNYCFNYRDQLLAGIIVAGWDKQKGGQVYQVPLGGMCIRRPYGIGGSGSSYVHGFIREFYRDGMSRDEMVEFVKKAIWHEMFFDGSSGSVCRVGSADFSLQFLKNAESNDEYKCLDVDRLVIHNAMVSSSCSRRTNRRAIQLFVKLLDNHTITLHTETTANVDNLKSIIEDKSKINKRVQLLFFSSKKLESTHCLEFYGIVNYSTIELSIKLSGGSDDQPNQVVPSMSGPPSSEEDSSVQSSSPEQSDSPASDGDFSSDNWTANVHSFLNIATPHSDLFTPAIRNGMVETCDKLLPTVPGYNLRLSRSSNLDSVRLLLLNHCSNLLVLLQNRTLRDELGEDVSSAVETSLQQLQNSLRCVVLTTKTKKKKNKIDYLRRALNNNFDKMSL